MTEKYGELEEWSVAGKNKSPWRKTCPIANFSTRNSTWNIQK
jgi:hypothetical protein